MKYEGVGNPDASAISPIFMLVVFKSFADSFILYPLRYCRKLIPVVSLKSVDRWFSLVLVYFDTSCRPLGYV